MRDEWLSCPNRDISGYQENPEIPLSDLNMPEMSGFELLSIVRRQFPTISLVGMSGAFSGTQIPCGVRMPSTKKATAWLSF
jgi:CheY-like chemotaxis protein